MTNPNNIVRVRARNGGRASVYEANGWCQSYTTGLLEGNGVLQNTSADMNVLVGGSATKPDVVIASNPAGYKIALDLVGQQAIGITNPATNSRISAIVAYTDDLSLATTEDTVTGAPASCGLIVVNGTAASSPTEPTDTQIRNAITADGATGSQACYCVIATILVASNTSVIDNSLITMKSAVINHNKIGYTTYSTTKEIECGTWINGKTIYKKTISFGALPNATEKSVSHNISGIDSIVKHEGIAFNSSGNSLMMPFAGTDSSQGIYLFVNKTSVTIGDGINRSSYNAYVTVYYTKS